MSLTDIQKIEAKKLYEQGLGSPTIARMLGVKTGAISYYIGQYVGLRTCSEAARKYSYDEQYFNRIDSADKAYWLGFIYADGYITRSKYNYILGIAISVKDIKHLYNFRKCINSNHPIHQYTVANGYNKGSKYCRIQICNQILYQQMIKFGVFENKTSILKPPPIDKKLFKHFLRGYFDGDGSITKSNRANGRVEYAIKILGTNDLLMSIKDFIESNDIAKINRFYKRHPTDIVESIEFAGNYQVLKFCKIIYEDSTMHLERKFQRYIELSSMLNSRVISKDIA